MKPIEQMNLAELADFVDNYHVDTLDADRNVTPRQRVASRLRELHTEWERRWNNLSVAQKIDAIAHPPDPYSSDLIIKNQVRVIANLEKELSDLKESTRWTASDVDAAYIMGCINAHSIPLSGFETFPTLVATQKELERLKRIGFNTPSDAIRALRYPQRITPPETP